MAAALKALGIEVIEGVDLDKQAMDRKVLEFSTALSGADAGIFFLCRPRSASERQHPCAGRRRSLDRGGARIEMVRLDVVQRIMQEEAKTNILFLDACRNNPLFAHISPARWGRAQPASARDWRRPVRRRHADQLLDAAWQRGARRYGAQLALRRRLGQTHHGVDLEPSQPSSGRRAQRRDTRRRRGKSRCRGSTRR